MASNNEPESDNPSITNEDEEMTIGAKLAKKLEALTTQCNENSPETENDADIYRNINQAATNILKELVDPDAEKNLLILALRLAESREQTRLAHLKLTEIEKRSVVFMRERDLALLENGRAFATKTKLEDLCRELHRRNQQIRDENVQRQQEDELKRRELAIKFQTTIDDIGSQLTAYSEKANSLHKQNIELSEELKSVFEKYELREQEIEKILKKKDADLHLTETSLEESNAVNTQRTELIKKEREIIEAERLMLYKKCEELAASESTLRSQLSIYAEGYQAFQETIQQSNEMIMSCQTEMEKMSKKIEELENERDDLRHRLKIAEQKP